ncbi:LacI family DNA-binding transcriptional regulator [Jannaschia rubra]|uniref:LacI family DNA-binding transcriptional regulator n=1 Tax=Jannaschia rubra TaxID=282197 RepID=UPI002490BEA0|nr:LacI family DNA-binding transcriptional regulator [Jannaschia rubra]
MKVRHNLRDVARQAEVSVTTVSRYLNGTLDLPAGTRGRIDAAVTRLGYAPNLQARRLSLGRSDSIALVLPDIANPFFSRLAAAIAARAEEAGKMVTLHATMNRPEREAAAIDLAVRNMADGLILVTTDPPPEAVLHRLARVVILDEDVAADAPRVLCDNRQGGELAGRHLWAAGHRRIGYIGGREDLASTAARLEGLREGMGGIAPVSIHADVHAKASGRHLALRFLARRAGETALFVGSDELCVGVLEVFRERGIRVPEDLSLISFDDVRSLHLFAPAITAITQPVEDLGRCAVDLLLQGDWDDPAFRGTTRRLPVHLTERASVRCIGQQETDTDPNKEKRS